MSFKDALEKSAEAQRKLGNDKKLKDKNIDKPTVSSKKLVQKAQIDDVLPKNLKKNYKTLSDLLSEEELKDITNRKTYQTYPTIHKLVKLVSNKKEVDLITYVNQAILERLIKDDAIRLYEFIYDKIKK